LFVAGIARGMFDVVSVDTATAGKIEFDTNPDDSDEFYLTFDASNADIEVRKGATVYFSGKLTGKPGTPTCEWQQTEVPLFNSVMDSEATARASYRQDVDCEQRFRVAVNDLAAGNYTLRVDGVEQGVIVVDGTGTGQIEVDLDPHGQLVEILGDTTVYFSRLFP
jgi:hypothetical protein